MQLYCIDSFLEFSTFLNEWKALSSMHLLEAGQSDLVWSGERKENGAA